MLINGQERVLGDIQLYCQGNGVDHGTNLFFKIKGSRDAIIHVTYGSKILHRDNFSGIFN